MSRMLGRRGGGLAIAVVTTLWGGLAAGQTQSATVSNFDKPTWKITGEPGKGLTVTTGDRFSLNVRSRIQIRYQLNVPPPDDHGERKLQQMVNIGTARLWFSGHVLDPKLTYMIQLAVAGRDFREDARSPIFDAFIDWKAHRDLSIRAGQFFVPFDRLRTVREFALQMVDRPAIVNEFTLDRDVGVTLYSDHFLGNRSPWAYGLSVFGGGGTNLTTAKEPGALVVGRLELRPLGDIDDDSEGDLQRRQKPGLAVGVGLAMNWNTHRQRSTTGSTYAGGTADYRHLATDLVFKWRGFALEAEYVWRTATVDEISSTKADGTPLTEYTRSGRGWVLQGSYAFRRPLELVGRFSRLYAATGTDLALVKDISGRPYEMGAGINYYFNEHRFKLQADWIARTSFDFDFAKANQVVHLQADATF
jgi:Phosphate-selective porin O and P